MDTIRQTEMRRQAILEDVGAMRSMERATLNEQMLPVKHKGKDEPVLRGPYYILVRRENGKSRSRRVPATDIEQVKQDVANHQRFRDLCKEYAELTERLGQLEREANASVETLKKAQIAVEKDHEVERILRAVGRSSKVDLDALETAVRDAVLQAGVGVLEEFLKDVGCGRCEEPVRCSCGACMASRGCKAKTLTTMLGKMKWTRSMFQCPDCGAVRYPGDEELDVVNTSRSPGVRRQTARLGAKEPFADVAKDLQQLAGIKLSRKDAERISESVGEDMEQRDKIERKKLRLEEPPPPEVPKTIDTLYIEFDGTGVPMTKNEVAGRKGKQKDGSAKTREAKLGCVFTQTAFDDKGRPIRDPASTTFTGAIETAAQFKHRIFAEAVRRGLYRAKRVVVISDGAEWIRNIVQECFPRAIHILDKYHAREHLWELCKCLFDRDIRRLNLYKDRWWEALDEGNIEKMAEEVRGLLPKDQNVGKDARRQIAYFEKNKERMRYAQFKADGLFRGSGVIEAGCRSVIGDRLKKSGMEWTVRGANDIIALRCATVSGRDEDYWEQRAA